MPIPLQHLRTAADSRYRTRRRSLVGVSALTFILLACVVGAWHVGSWGGWWDASARPGISMAGPSPGPSVPEQPQPSETSARPADRPIYPYSVIEGGARDSQELRQAIDSDPVVAHHFADFDVARAKPVPLAVSRSFFVSFRRGHDVFWTRRKLTVPAGEDVLTDGVNLARARCGNRLAETPRGPVAPSDPTPVELNTPLPSRTRSFPIPFDLLTAYDLLVSSGGFPPPVTVGEGSISPVGMPSEPFAYVWPIPWAPRPAPSTEVDHQPGGFTPAGGLEPIPEPGPNPTPGPGSPMPAPSAPIPGPDIPEPPADNPVPGSEYPIPGPDNPVPVPEPGTLLLVLPALGGSYLLRRLKGSR